MKPNNAIKFKTIFSIFLLIFLSTILVTCQTPPPPPPPQPVIITPTHGPQYNIGIQHGKSTVMGSEKDYELVIYIHDNVIGDSTREKDFREGFILGFTEKSQKSESEAKEAVSLAVGAASSHEYRHGVEIAEKVVKARLTDISARATLKAPKSLVEQLSIKAGFIKGYGEGGESMYYGLIR